MLKDQSLFKTRGGRDQMTFHWKYFLRPTRRTEKRICGLLDTALKIFDAHSYTIRRNKHFKMEIYQSCQSCQGLLQAKVTAPPLGMQHEAPENPLSLVHSHTPLPPPSIFSLNFPKIRVYPPPSPMFNGLKIGDFLGICVASLSGINLVIQTNVHQYIFCSSTGPTAAPKETQKYTNPAMGILDFFVAPPI